MTTVPDLQAFVGGDFGPFPAWDAVNAPMIRHELGLYEMVYMIPVMALFLYIGRQDRVPGTFLALFGIVPGMPTEPRVTMMKKKRVSFINCSLIF